MCQQSTMTDPKPVIIVPVEQYTAMINELRSLRSERTEIVTACRTMCEICHPIEEWRGETLMFLRVAQSVVNRADGLGK